MRRCLFVLLVSILLLVGVGAAIGLPGDFVRVAEAGPVDEIKNNPCFAEAFGTGQAMYMAAWYQCQNSMDPNACRTQAGNATVIYIEWAYHRCTGQSPPAPAP